MEDFVNNLNGILDYLGNILEIIGGCAAISAVFPKAALLDTKGKLFISYAKKVVNIGLVVYNALVVTANIGGFNFLAAKNKNKE